MTSRSIKPKIKSSNHQTIKLIDDSRFIDTVQVKIGLVLLVLKERGNKRTDRQTSKILCINFYIGFEMRKLIVES